VASSTAVIVNRCVMFQLADVKTTVAGATLMVEVKAANPIVTSATGMAVNTMSKF